MLTKLKQGIRPYTILAQDWLRYELSCNQLGYLRIRNRMERLGRGPIANSYVCLWPYTSRLKAVEEWPFIGRLLFKRILRDNKFSFRDDRKDKENIDVSVLIGHRGQKRIDLLLSTLRSFATQEGVSIECIVIEQDSKQQIDGKLPGWVRYAFQELNSENGGYNRASAFNFGARLAQGKVLILHDNDMLVPVDYCNKIFEQVQKGYAALNTKRFVFYLSKEDTQNVSQSVDRLKSATPLYIVQNLEAGGSMAITKEAYFEIGGMDEDFVGWGGEDNEFWQRCSSLRRWIWGFSPIIHLWHESQPLKECTTNENITRARMLETIDVMERIRILKEKNNMIHDKE